jgi:hypothetical protein
MVPEGKDMTLVPALTPFSGFYRDVRIGNSEVKVP